MTIRNEELAGPFRVRADREPLPTIGAQSRGVADHVAPGTDLAGIVHDTPIVGARQRHPGEAQGRTPRSRPRGARRA